MFLVLRSIQSEVSGAQNNNVCVIRPYGHRYCMQVEERGDGVP